jgi:hypothetical protein
MSSGAAVSFSGVSSVSASGTISTSALTTNCTGNSNCTATVTCSGNLVVTGGGMQYVSGGNGVQFIHMTQSYPSSANAWTVSADNVQTGTITIKAMAICTQ